MRPRYGRIAMLGVSVIVTLTTVLGGVGVLPSGGSASYAAGAGAQDAEGERGGATASLSAAEPRTAGATDAEESAEPEEPEAAPDPTEPPDPDDLLVPEDSGEGRRVVFDETAQRVWLVNRDDSVERTYLVSGSVYDNLDPGTYSVFSSDEHATGIDGSALRFMVRFTTGAEAAIGFHDIPVLDGEKVQTPDELGTPLSHGCIRQHGKDARALWEFAPLGTKVVVVD
jgi:L,D-transpeptidase catalytic domain